MPASSHCQTWFAEHAIEDTRMAEAYESLGDKGRAILKKCVARHYDVWGERPQREVESRMFRQGFGVELTQIPAPWALIVCDADYPSPAALVAAIMPALLAGVSQLIPCFLPVGGGISAPLLASLELAGVEEAYAAEEGEAISLARALTEEKGKGRIVLLGRGSSFESLALFAHRADIHCRSLTGMPRYYSSRLCAVAEHCFDGPQYGPDALEEPEVVCPQDPDAMFLHLDASHESVWFWPSVGPDWFRSKRMRFYS